MDTSMGLGAFGGIERSSGGLHGGVDTWDALRIHRVPDAHMCAAMKGCQL